MSVYRRIFCYIKESLNKLIPFMVRQTHHERNQRLTARPELVEGLNQRFLKYRQIFYGSGLNCNLIIGRSDKPRFVTPKYKRLTGMKPTIPSKNTDLTHNLFYKLMYAKYPLLTRTCLLRHLLGLIFVGLAVGAIAAPAGKPLADLVISTNKGSELQLEVRQMPMVEVLKMIEVKTQMPIHYSVLPEGLVTATCVGSSLKQVLECLLDRKADLIVRYPRNADKSEGKGQLAEAWVLGSRLDGTVAKLDCPLTDKTSSTLPIEQSQQVADTTAKPNPSDTLLNRAQSKNVAGRVEAIGALLTVGTKGDPKIQEMLEDAIHDQDANVRAQAVSTLTHWSNDTESISAALREAINDDSADVRLMAVDGITDDVDLLQQAVNDSDEVVSTMAATKLEELRKPETQ
jgi:HEAT repeats